MAGNANSGRRRPAKSAAAKAAIEKYLLGIRYSTAPQSEITETDCKEASRGVLRLRALEHIDDKEAETYDKVIRTTLQAVRQEFSSSELRKLEEMERRVVERERKAMERESKARQRRE